MNPAGAMLGPAPTTTRRPPGPPRRGLLGNLKEFSADRLGALGGTVEVRSAPGVGTTVAGSISCQPTP